MNSTLRFVWTNLTRRKLRTLVTACGVAVAGAILSALISSEGGLTAATLQQVLEGGAAYVNQLAESERSTIVSHLDHAYRVLFFVVAAITGVGAILSRSIPKPDWGRTEEGANSPD